MSEAQVPRYRTGQRWPCSALSRECEPFVCLWGVHEGEVYELDADNQERVIVRTEYRAVFLFLPEAQELYGLKGVVVTATAEVLDASLRGGPPEPSPLPDWLPDDPQDWVEEAILDETITTGTLAGALARAMGEICSLTRAMQLGREQLVTQLLLDNPALAGKPLLSNDGWYPIHAAASSASPLYTSLLLLYGADVSVRTNGGRTALHIAAEFGRLEPLRLLLDAGAEIGAADASSCTPLRAATQRGGEDCLACAAMLLNRGAAPDFLSLVRLGRFDHAAALLTAEPHAGASLVREQTLLEEFVLGVHHAAALRRSEDNSTERSAARMSAAVALPLLTRLLDLGADPNSGRALFHAARLHDISAARLLLERGADPNKETSHEIFLPDSAPLTAMKTLLKQHGADSAQDPERVVQRTSEQMREGLDDDARFSALEERTAAWRKLGQYERALADAEEMIRLSPDSPQGHYCVAWLLATCPEDAFRDGARARESAQTAVDLNGCRGWISTEGGKVEVFQRTEFEASLAAALAEMGEIDDAIMELDTAKILAKGERMKQLNVMHRAFNKGSPFREAPPSPELAAKGRKLAEEIEPNPPAGEAEVEAEEEHEEDEEYEEPSSLIDPDGEAAISDSDFGVDGVRRLLAEREIKSVVSLKITYSGLGDEGAELLASDLKGQLLSTLALENNEITDRGGLALAACRRWSSLTVLSLAGNKLGNQTGIALAAAEHLSGLTGLDLNSNRIRLEGVRALAASPHFANLTHLNLFSNRIRNEGAACLASSPCLGKLEVLDLTRCRLTGEAARALASGLLGSLLALVLNYNRLGNRGGVFLAQAKGLPQLRRLELAGTDTGPEGMIALAASPLLGRITELELSTNPLGPKGAAALAKSPHVGKLVRLALGGCNLGTDGAASLAESTGLQRLESITVRKDDVGARGEHILRERFGHRLQAW